MPLLLAPTIGTLLGGVLAAIVVVAATVAAQTPPPAASIIQTLDELPYDENGKLSTHLLLYPKGGECAGFVENQFFRGGDGRGAPYGFELHAVEGEAERAFFGDDDGDGNDNAAAASSSSSCRAVCVERGVDRSLVSSPMPQRYFNGEDNGRTYSDWFETQCERAHVTFFNYHSSSSPLNVYWVDQESGARVAQDMLEFGELHQRPVDTYLGHSFVFEDGETGDIVHEHTVEFDGMVAIGSDVPLPPTAGKNFTEVIHDMLNLEWDRHKRVRRTFTALGFRRGRLPDDLFGSMGAFYYNNRRIRTREAFPPDEVFLHVNWWEADIDFVQIPAFVKKRWQSRLKELVQGWAGTELEQTALYGLRRYGTGSRLLAHVDMMETHAASLIVNVDQGNVAEAWPVDIFDHADRLHRITMEPGDVIYYESAKCIHARNEPLRGEGAYYVNLFAHYRPVGDDRWFTRANPGGTPEPLIDVGECRVEVEDGRLNEAGKQEEVVVSCDDPSVGPFLSPTLFTATSGESLFEWWRSARTGSVAPETDRREEL